MRRHHLRRTFALVTTTVLTCSLTIGTASGAPAAPDPAGQDQATPSRDVDNRGGAAQPSERQRALAGQSSTTVRWNRYGTPGTLLPRTDRQRRDAAADPVAIARSFLTDNREAFGLSAAGVGEMDVLVSRPMGQGAYVLLRQRFGDLPSIVDGLAAVGIRDGGVVYLSSTISPERKAPEQPTIAPEAALTAAAADAGIPESALGTTRVRLGAVPMPGAAPRSAYQVVLVAGQDTGYTTYVDARTGAVLLREDLVDHDTDNPEWDVFPANPPADYSSRDSRQRWCLTAERGCVRTVRTADGGLAWDIDPATGAPSLTSAGNAEKATQKWDDLASGTVGTRTATPSPTREYTYPWTNQWHQTKCDPAVFATAQQNDIDAALTNLFAMHNRMHDWSYFLGFTEDTWNMQASNGTNGGLGGDAERGNAQAGGRAGGAPPDFASRNNANQITPPDGVPPTTNMYLWQPTPGGFYPPCVDGDYDMTVIGHEYSHAISGRLIAGPDLGWSGAQAGAMNESTSDQYAMEYLYEYGFRPRGDTPYVTGGYVTGDLKAGIRDYDLSRNPLNYSDVGFDIVGAEVHADGEIWNAVNFDLRQAMVDRYGLGTPALQRACADGKVPVEQCPGNRRWVQQSFDALLLSASGAVSFVDMRDAILAANEVRYGGADVALLQDAFAQNGLGRDATSAGPNDPDPTPSFASASGHNATLRFAPTGSRAPARLYVGDYEARAVPIADTDPSTPLPDTVEIAPGRYSFVVVADGFGSSRFQRSFRAGEHAAVRPLLQTNLASQGQGATASGDGVNLNRLIDDTEATNWASVGSPVAGKSVTVDLAGDHPQLVTRVQVSAYLRPAITGDPDPGTQNRFTALRQFEVLSCDAARGTDCANPANYRRVFTSPRNAFPADVPRPTAPDLSTRSFRIAPTVATHLMIRVVANQCTGGPDYAGDQDNDPRSTSDCTTGNPTVAQTVRIAELQAFTF
ncbi:M36 family metallopeptidase [Actinophytocola sp.]|uniref:M36 family metallopeptidase n=1 Tax=Actinophytocola sp. TaxID=1872138 RepID=UPI00389AB438